MKKWIHIIIIWLSSFHRIHWPGSPVASRIRGLISKCISTTSSYSPSSAKGVSHTWAASNQTKPTWHAGMIYEIQGIRDWTKWSFFFVQNLIPFLYALLMGHRIFLFENQYVCTIWSELKSSVGSTGFIVVGRCFCRFSSRFYCKRAHALHIHCMHGIVSEEKKKTTTVHRANGRRQFAWGGEQEELEGVGQCKAQRRRRPLLMLMMMVMQLITESLLHWFICWDQQSFSPSSKRRNSSSSAETKHSAWKPVLC